MRSRRNIVSRQVLVETNNHRDARIAPTNRLITIISAQCWNLLLMLLLAKKEIKEKQSKKKQSKKKRIRRWWVRPINYGRETQGIYRNLFRELRTTDHEEFFDYTRMNVQQFDYICDLVRPYLTKRSIKTPLPLQLRVAITLEMLARGTSIRTSSWSYRIGRSTAYKVFRETCSTLWKALQPIYLQALTRETMVQISEDFFNRWQFPNCIGAIDGKHISIQCPPKTGSQFYSSYKKRFSIILIAACDAKYRFTWVDVGDYGSQSDGGMWASSAFGQAIDADEIDFPFPKEIPGSDVILPFTFVADEAFPLGIHMMRPYARTYRTFGNAERIFNYRLSRARRTIENTFGIMSSRWRILRRDLCCIPETAEDIVKAIVCLHNFLMVSEDDLAPLERTYCPASMLDRERVDGDVIEGDWRREMYRGPITDVGRLGSNNPTVRADAQRNILKDYFCSDIGQLDWQWEQALRAYNVNPP